MQRLVDRAESDPVGREVIGRRGFLGGLLALIAAPLAYFPKKPIFTGGPWVVAPRGTVSVVSRADGRLVYVSRGARLFYCPDAPPERRYMGKRWDDDDPNRVRVTFSDTNSEAAFAWFSRQAGA